MVTTIIIIVLSRRQPHLLLVSAVDRRQTWSRTRVDDVWHCLDFSTVT